MYLSSKLYKSLDSQTSTHCALVRLSWIIRYVGQACFGPPAIQCDGCELRSGKEKQRVGTDWGSHLKHYSITWNFTDAWWQSFVSVSMLTKSSSCWNSQFWMYSIVTVWSYYSMILYESLSICKYNLYNSLGSGRQTEKKYRTLLSLFYIFHTYSKQFCSGTKMASTLKPQWL